MVKIIKIFLGALSVQQTRPFHWVPWISLVTARNVPQNKPYVLEAALLGHSLVTGGSQKTPTTLSNASIQVLACKFNFNQKYLEELLLQIMNQLGNAWKGIMVFCVPTASQGTVDRAPLNAKSALILPQILCRLLASS